MPKFKTFRQMERILESQGFPKSAMLVRQAERNDAILANATIEQKTELFKKSFGGPKQDGMETPEREDAINYAKSILGDNLDGE